MSDDLSVRLSEASRHFNAQSYDACAKVLASCPHSDSDPKLRHNSTIVDFSRQGFVHTLSALTTIRSILSSGGSIVPPVNNNNNNNSSNSGNNSPVVTNAASSSSGGLTMPVPASKANNSGTSSSPTTPPTNNNNTTTTTASAATTNNINPATNCCSSQFPYCINMDSASWTFDGQDVMHYNEAVLRAQMGEIDAAYEICCLLLQCKAPLSTRTQVRAAATALILKKTISSRNNSNMNNSNTSISGSGGGSSSNITSTPTNSATPSFSSSKVAAIVNKIDISEKYLQDLLTTGSSSSGFNDLSQQEQKELQSVVAAACASDLPSLQTWLKDHSNKQAADVAVMLNNAAVQLMFSGDVATAAQLLSQASTAAETISNACPMQTSTIRFNLGLAHFAAGNLPSAAEAFLKIQRALSDNAVYWFRLGQLLSQMATEQATQSARNRLGVALKQRTQSLHENGQRPCVSAVVVPIASESLFSGSNNNSSSTTEKSSSSSYTPTDCAQLYAISDTALQNSYVLILGCANANNVSSSSSKTKEESGNTVVNADIGSIVNSATTGTQEMIQSLLMHLTFVSLSRGNPHAAAKYVMDYFSVNKCSTWTNNRDITSTMLCYAVEALCSVQRAPAALKLLQSYDLGDLVVSSSSGDGGTVLDNSYTDALMVNMTIAHIMNGNWQKACSIGSTLLPKLYARSSNAVLLGAYLELAKGNREKALEIFEKQPLREPV